MDRITLDYSNMLAHRLGGRGIARELLERRRRRDRPPPQEHLTHL